MQAKRLLKNIGFYFIGVFLTKIIQFLFIPLYSRYIKTSDFGYYDLTLSVVALVIPLLYQSIWEGVLRFAIENENDQRKILSTTNIYCIGLTLIYSIIFLILSAMFKFKYSIAILFMGISQIGVFYWQFAARALKKNKIFAVSTVVNSLVTILLNLILVIVYKWGLLALFVANIAGSIAMIIVQEMNFKLLKRTKISDFDKKLLVSIIKYSIPLSVNAVSWWLVTSCNNFVICYKINVNANGVYALASRFGSIMALVTTVVNMAWLEEAFRTYEDSDKDEYFNKVLDVLTRFVLSGVALIIPLTYIFYERFVFGDYKGGAVLTPIIYLSAAYSTLASHLGSGFLARKESNIIFITTLVGGMVSAVGGLILAKPYGLMGVVGTSLLGYLIMFFARIPMLKKRMNLRINYSLTIGMTIFCFLVMIICSHGTQSLLYQMIVFLATGIVAIIVNYKMISFIISKVKKKLSLSI